MKTLTQILTVLTFTLATSFGQMSNSISFNPGNGSLGGTYDLSSSGPVMGPYVPGVGQTPTGEVDYTYQAGPTAGTYYYSPLRQYHTVFRDPGDGSEPYLYGIIEFAVNGAGNPTSSVREIGFDQNGNLRYGSLESWPELNIAGYSVNMGDSGFGPGLGAPNPTSTINYTEMAQDLTAGLTFENGQWTPTP
jgi:hypothetical protein